LRPESPPATFEPIMRLLQNDSARDSGFVLKIDRVTQSSFDPILDKTPAGEGDPTTSNIRLSPRSHLIDWRCDEAAATLGYRRVPSIETAGNAEANALHCGSGIVGSSIPPFMTPPSDSSYAFRGCLPVRPSFVWLLGLPPSSNLPALAFARTLISLCSLLDRVSCVGVNSFPRPKNRALGLSGYFSNQNYKAISTGAFLVGQCGLSHLPAGSFFILKSHGVRGSDFLPSSDPDQSLE
jgi:hypothetical protein